MTPHEFETLIRSLIALPNETEWVEFKHNNTDPDEIGEYASALSNSVALDRRTAGYVVWGIEDGTHKILGTTFRPREMKVKGQELENWLLTQLEPQIDVRIHQGEIEGMPLVLFEVPPASHRPVAFKGVEYIRIGSYKKKLKDHPEKERALWRRFDDVPFERGVATANVSSDDVLSLIDYPRYFELMAQRLPDSRPAILERLASERIIHHKAGDRYDISNLALSSSPRLCRTSRSLPARRSASSSTRAVAACRRSRSMSERRATRSVSRRSSSTSTTSYRRTSRSGRRCGARYGCSRRSPSVNWWPTR